MLAKEHIETRKQRPCANNYLNKILQMYKVRSQISPIKVNDNKTQNTREPGHYLLYC